ncbi:MAG: hypothetical protein JSR77_05150 [Planctomycetes bacterium]|nr:hypothetical protein [Planctomycetota bacterium]
MSPSAPSSSNPGASRVGPRTVIIIVAVFVMATLLLGVCGGLLLPALSSARNSARMVKSQANLREIGAALSAYASASGDELPEPAADLKTRLSGAIASPQVWVAPSDTPPAVSYFYVPIGNLRNIKHPSEQPLVYEAADLWRKPGGNILYADFKVKHIDGLRYQQIIDTMKLPDGTPWTPHKR